MVPKVNTQGMMDSRLRRILDFAMNSRLAIFLCDHSRPMSVLFEKLECKLSLNVEPPILSRNEFWSKMNNLFLWLSIHRFILGYIKTTSQAELRRFTNMAWDHASHEEKLEIKNEYDVSIVGRVINIYSILTVTLFFGIFRPINSVAVNNFFI